MSAATQTQPVAPTQTPLLAYLYTTLAVVFWGGTFTAGKFVVFEISPLLVATLRYVGASVLMLAILGLRERPLRWHWSLTPLLFLLGVGLTGTAIPNVLYLTGLQFSSAVNASLVNAGSPALTALLAIPFLREASTPRQWTGILLSMVGVILVISEGSLERLATLHFNFGDVLFVITTVVWSCNNIFIRLALRYYTPLATAAYSSALGAVFLLVWAGPSLTPNALAPLTFGGWMGLLYLTMLGSVAAIVLWNVGIHHLGATRATIFVNLMPIVGVLSAVLILGETYTMGHLIGTAFVLGGIYLTVVGRRTAEVEMR